MIQWVRVGRTVNEEGRTLTYHGVGTDLTIESRKRHIPHASRGGTWDHTTYFVLDDGKELIERCSMADAKEWAQKYQEAKN